MLLSRLFSVQMADAAVESDHDSDLELDVESDDDVPLSKHKQKISRYISMHIPACPHTTAASE